MDRVFPLGFPAPTAFYLSLYVITLVVHVVFMSYVLAGSACLAFVSLFPGRGDLPRQRQPMALILRDWMPFALSAAITAGVAPLLFVQVLYKKNFYSANLLLFHRWMSILPVLIVGFYLFYLLKTRRISTWARGVRALVGIGAFACIAFTGCAWAENHLLSTNSNVWPGMYASRSMTYGSPELLPRVAVWFCGAIPTMCTLVGWQLWAKARQGDAAAAVQSRGVVRLALAGFAAILGSLTWYVLTVDGEARAAAVSPAALPYLVVGGVGTGIQLAAWIGAAVRGRLGPIMLLLASAGLVLTILGAAVTREVVRISRIDIAALYDQHARAAQMGGMFVFLGFLVLNGVLIAWCIRLATRRRVTPPP